MARATRLEEDAFVECHLKCKGMSQEEFFELYRELEAKGVSPAIRNPDPLSWDPKTVHELMVSIGPTALAAAAFGAKRAYTWLEGVITRKLEERKAGRVDVTIYDGNGKVISVVQRVVDKPRRKK
jgi:hypothetical protein